MLSNPTILDWLTAIGTLGAAIVALAIAVAPMIGRRLSRPKLEVVCGQVEPHVRPEMEGGRVTSVLLRVEVRNLGRTEAKGVRAHIRRWWAQDDRARWVEYDIDPLPVRWTSRPFDAGEGAEALQTDLPKDGSDFLELSRYDVIRGKTWLRTPDRLERPFIVESTYPLGEHRIEVTVSAENAEMISSVISHRVSREQLISDVRRTEAPQEDVRRVGLFQLLQTEDRTET